MSTATGTAPTAGEPAEQRSPITIPPKYIATIRSFVRILSYGSTLDRVVLAGSLCCSLGAGLTMPLMNILFGQLVGTFTSFFKQGEQETVDEFIHAVNQCVLYIVYLFTARLVLSYLSNLGFRMTSLRISAAIRLVYLRSLFSLPISTLDMLPTGQTAAIITITASTLQLGISEKIGQFFSSLSAVLTALAVAFFYNWLLTLATSMGIMFIGLVYYLTTPFLTERMTEVQEMDVKAASVATEAFSSNRMLAACGAELKIYERYAMIADQLRQRGRGMAWMVAVQQALIYFGIYATFALAFWYAFRLYLIFSITSSEPLIVVLLCVMLMASSIGQITAPLSAASQAADASVIFHSIIDAPKPTYGTAKGPGVRADGDIVFENVNFVYPTRPDVKIIEGLCLRFPAGKVTAIVGPSGSGKSTIVGILQRWYEFNGDMATNQLVLWLRNGLVSVSGRELREIDIKWWRNQIGMVQQDNALFNTTIYKNVEYGLIGTEWEFESDRKKAKLIKAACKDAFADEFISRLPDGYRTTVGESGIKLSGGQRQRLAIARAIVKQPKILILDEATSAIDVRSEQIVQAALDRASLGRTTIMIAHRLGTIRKADNIIVLRHGKVVQQGSHERLLAEVGGAYSLLATAQNLEMGDEDEKMSLGSWAEGTMVDKTYSEEVESSGEYEKPRRNNRLRPHRRRSSEDCESVDETLLKVAGKDSGRPFGSFGMLLGEQMSKWKLYVLILLAALGAGASTPLQAYLFAMLVSLFSLWGPYLTSQVNFWCLMFVYLATGVGLSHMALAWSTTTLGFAITRTYRKEYFASIMAKSASFFDEEGHSAGALTGRLATDPTQLQQLLGTNMAFVLISFLNLVGCIVISLAFGWKLTIVALGSSMPVVVAAMFYRVRHEIQFESMNNAVFAESAKFATESIGAIRTVSSLTMEEGICQRYENLLRQHIKDAFRKARFSVLLFSFSDSISLLCMAFVLWYGGQLLATHEYSPFQYSEYRYHSSGETISKIPAVVVYIAVVQGGMSAGQWLSFGPNIASATAAADRILSIREGDGDHVLFTEDTTADNGDSEKGVELEFKNVWFEYPTRSAPVLNGLDMKIERGQFAAIVGPSGAGKSTIISLLERFYTATFGQILHNGLDITTLDLSQYRKGISLVAQEASLFSGSIRDNILLGIPNDATVPLADLHAAARDAGIHDFIVSLPEGYETPLGPAGLALSGGQKQRVSIARALVRRPSLLLLDEATSSLDSETERAVQDTLEATRGGRTMVVVAHRLATVQNADIIFVMGEGRVVERGNHASLIAQRGLYFQMCQSQALDR
ncbi:ABC transporter [Pseudomassariella vexata]|uniref:ABC transporter n=1 Tax=Pseudomassariella vexata TaxID=1141098 RepID=A0A1Y2DEZ3_9PEZI|nr:ABC transporter [Pseudomassariella vexata]ORY57852.1 ABC transporter [Pseudomassariella vexata]